MKTQDGKFVLFLDGLEFVAWLDASSLRRVIRFCCNATTHISPPTTTFGARILLRRSQEQRKGAGKANFSALETHDIPASLLFQEDERRAASELVKSIANKEMKGVYDGKKGCVAIGRRSARCS
jgi:hypothetical protein